MSSPAFAPSFWQRRLIAPLRAQLTQGISPDRLAATLAIGTACSLFPFLGATSLLNLLVGIWLRLNQPILQVLNQLLGVVQLAMIFIYVRTGEWLWRVEAAPFSLGEMIRVFKESSFGEFLRQFGWVGIHAFSAWLATTPLLIAAVYFSIRPLIRKFASKLPMQA